MSLRTILEIVLVVALIICLLIIWSIYGRNNILLQQLQESARNIHQNTTEVPPLTKERLDELLPEELIDTPEEIQEVEQRLDALRNGTGGNTPSTNPTDNEEGPAA